MTGDGDRPAGQSLAADCAAAFLLLSRIPAGWYRFPDDRPPDFTSATWAFPLVGLVIGAACGADDFAFEFTSRLRRLRPVTGVTLSGSGSCLNERSL